MNAVFATLYWLVPGSVANARLPSFADNLFFSIETLATVGYGKMYPATLYGRMVAATEILCGLAFTAILTGLTFVRFSRPRAKLIFAANPVVTMHNGKPTLMVRIGNGRAAVLAEARAQLNVLLSETTAEGKPFRRAQKLRLERAHLPIFPLFWTLMDVLDERSPLHGYDAARAIEADTQVFVTVEARDPMLTTTVHDIPQLCGGGYPIRPALHGCRDHGRGRNASFGLDRNRRNGARCRGPSGTGLDRAGRYGGIAVTARASRRLGWLCPFRASARSTWRRSIACCACSEQCSVAQDTEAPIIAPQPPEIGGKSSQIRGWMPCPLR